MNEGEAERRTGRRGERPNKKQRTKKHEGDQAERAWRVENRERGISDKGYRRTATKKATMVTKRTHQQKSPTVCDARNCPQIQKGQIIKSYDVKSAQDGWTTGMGNFDLLVLKGEVALLHEIKTINANERLQIIDAIGKLTYYEAFDVPGILKNSKAAVQKVLVFSRRPDQTHIDFLKKLGISILWFNSDGKLDGEVESRTSLDKLVKED